jgi:hypothetical protein
MKANAEIAANLRRSKEILQESGRTTGTLFYPRTGCFCLLGAVGAAVLGEELKEDVVFKLNPYRHFEFDGAAHNEAKALAANLPPEFLAKRDTTAELATYNEVYWFNDREVQHGDEGDQIIYDLIDRTVASLEAA